MTRITAIFIVGLLFQIPVAQAAAAPEAQGQHGGILEAVQPMAAGLYHAIGAGVEEVMMPSILAVVDASHWNVSRVGVTVRCVAVLIASSLLREVVFSDKPILTASVPLVSEDPVLARAMQVAMIIGGVVTLEKVGTVLDEKWEEAHVFELLARPFDLGAAFSAANDFIDILCILSSPAIANGLANPIVSDIQRLVGRMLVSVSIRALLGLRRLSDRENPLPAALKDTAKVFTRWAGYASLHLSVQAIIASRNGGVAHATVAQIATVFGAAAVSWLATKDFPNLLK